MELARASAWARADAADPDPEARASAWAREAAADPDPEARAWARA